MSLTLTLERGGGEVSGSGTNIELDGTIAGGAIESVEMNGDTEQQAYSGKNLLNITKGTYTQNGITFTQNPDGSVTMNGTSTGNAYYEMNNTAASQTTITSGVRYTLSIGNVTLPAGQVIVQIRKVNPNVIYAAVNDKSASFTAPETTTTFTYIGVYGSGVTLNNVTIYPMLEVGSSMTSFEPYVGGTASPNPDYPQAVQTVTGRQVVTISDGGSQSQEYEINLGKNLLDNYNPTVVSSDTTWTPTANGGLYTATRSWTGGVKWKLTVETGATYQFQYKERTDQNLYLYITTYTDSTYTTIKTRIVNDGRYTKYPIVPDSPYLEIQFQSSAAMTNVAIKELMFEKATTRTTYAPYFTPIELCKIGTYQDYIYKSGEDWYVHKDIEKFTMNGSENWSGNWNNPATPDYWTAYLTKANFTDNYDSTVAGTVNSRCSHFVHSPTNSIWNLKDFGVAMNPDVTYTLQFKMAKTFKDNVADWKTWLGLNNMVYYYPLATPTDTQITYEPLVTQLEALNAAQTYDGETIITVSSENLAGPLEVTASSNIAKTYTEVEIGSPFTITDVEGKSSNTTLDGNVYVDWAYNKKQYSFDLFNLTPQDYADIRAFYDYQFNNSAFPTITVPELSIDKLPVYMEISSRNIINQCLLTDKLTIKFRETVQP